MDSPKIMVVEDEGIIAQDIKNCLENLGYTVPEVVFTGKDAIEKAEQHRPDLVLMDIVLKGDKDGIETAAEIRNKYNIPIVYLTAYEDDKTLKRAKLTEPLGYILKPFEERYLRSSIEMALYKHKMEIKLKENERWLGTILNSVGDAVIVTDERGVIRFMNPMAVEVTGWELKDAIGTELKRVFRIITDDTREPVEDPVERVLRDNIILGRSNHCLLISKQGREIFIDHSAAPMHDENGIITGVVLIVQDITDRKRVETAIKESENRFRNLFDYATDAIIVQTIGGSIVSMNNEACNLLKYSKADIPKLMFSDILSADALMNEEKINSLLKETKSSRFETRYRRKDGSLVDVEVSMRIIRIQDEDVIQSFVRDITERKKVQKEITLLAHAIKGIIESVSITDMNNRVIFVNDAFEKLYGFTQDELIGKPINIIRSQKNPPNLGKEILDSTMNLNGWQGELINRTKEGKEFPTLLSTSLVKDENGKPIAMIGVAADISERKTLESALKESERDYRGLFENAHDAIVIFRPEDEIVLDVNDSACKIYGYSRSEMIGQSLDNITNEPGIGKKYLNKIEGNGSNLRFETVHRRRDGSEVIFEVNAAVVDYKGQKAIVSINRDITQRKHSEEVILESEKRLRLITQQVPGVLWTTDVNLNFTSSAGIGLEKLNMVSGETTGMSIFDYFKSKDPEYRPILAHRNALKGINSSFEFKLMDLVFQAFVEPLMDLNGNIIGCIGFALDITERKRSDQAVKQSELKYKNLSQNAPVAVTRINYETMKYEFVNDSFVKLTGFMMEEYNKLGKEEQTRLIHADDRAKVSESYSSWKSNGYKGTNQLEYRMYNRNNEVVWVNTYAYADFDESGNPVAVNQIFIDITERKNAEEAILENERKYKNLAENAPIAVTRILPDSSSYDFVNEEFIRQSGYSMEEFNLLGRDQMIELIYTEDRNKLFSFYKRWEEDGYKGIQHIDYRIVNRFKKILWLDTYLYADYDAHGNVKAINQICIDITEQRRTQQALQESEKRFRALIENSTDMIALYDRNASIIYASPSTTRILGYELDEYIGRSSFDFIHPDDLEFCSGAFAGLLQNPGGSVTIEYRQTHKNGEWRWIEASSTNLLSEPTVEALVVNYRDITERKLAEEQLTLQKSYFQQLFENSPEGIVILDNRDRIVNINKGFEIMFQFNPEEVTGKDINSILIPANLSEEASQLSLFVIRGEVIHKETVRKRKDGSLVDVSILAYPITLGKDQIGVYGIYSDISERKETEKALRNSEERYKAFVKQSSEGIWRFEFLEPIPIRIPKEEQVKRAFKYGYVAECNDVMAKMYGYENAEDIVGARLSELLVETEPRNKEYIKSFIESEYRLTDVESYEPDREGNIKIFLNNLVGIVENENLIRAWGTHRDITERKKAEQEIRKNERYLRTINNFATSLIKRNTIDEILIDVTNNCIANLGFVDFVTYLMDDSETKLVQKTVYGLRSKDIANEINLGEGIIGTVAQTGEAELISDLTSDPRYVPGDRQRFSEITVPIKHEGKVIGVIDSEHPKKGFYTEEHLNILETIASLASIKIDRAIAEENLHRTQFRLATLLSNLPDVVLYETGAGKEFISENVINLLGYPAEMFAKDRNFFPSLMHPADNQSIQEEIKEWYAEGRPGILNLEFRCRRTDGSYIWLEDHMVSVKASQNEHHMAGVLIDITEHKQAEEKLKQLAEKLQLSNKELEQFAYVASHDLQEPLRMIASYIQLLQKRYKGKIDAEADEFINFAVDGVTRMKTLINDLLVYSRMNTREYEPQPVDCNEIMKQVVTDLKTTIEENEAKVTYDPLPVITGNPLHLSQLFQNLVSNGIKFRSELPPEVHISFQKKDNEYLFSVKDNGIGIEKEFAERIFIIFQRLHNYKEYPGTGIGLAICKKIVEKMGGRIWVESEPGNGATFYFTVPIPEEMLN